MRFFPVRKEISRGGMSILAGGALSEILARAWPENELLIPPPSSFARTVWHLAMSGEFNKHFAATATEFIYGFCAACAIGVVLGYLMGMYRWFDEIKEGHYKGKKIPAMSDSVDSSMIEEAQKLAGFKP